VNNQFTEGVDYCFIYPKDDPHSVHIRLLSGTYKDTVYKYGTVKFEESGDNLCLLFQYDVVESTYAKPRKLEKDRDFKTYIGDILVQIMSENIDQEIIDETNDNNTEISNYE
jgi:hypothetical protein